MVHTLHVNNNCSKTNHLERSYKRPRPEKRHTAFTVHVVYSLDFDFVDIFAMFFHPRLDIGRQFPLFGQVLFHDFQLGFSLRVFAEERAKQRTERLRFIYQE